METYKVTIELTKEELIKTMAALMFFKRYWEQRGTKMPVTTKLFDKFKKINEEIKNSPF